ncbi:MAG: DUF3696 domain-containing protein [Rhodobacteraceae bacterium]|nr:DUF3696 domain-containing protein [Paracoccaceae bacterium]MCY4328271.1 DUF3696 domain-containing protein [Paracoccaceae bacterium]
MISRIDLRHFKCFEALKLPVRPLTLLSGGNASGKSSAMQPLVLLHQTMREHEWSSRLMLNGATMRLGTAREVVDQVHGKRSVHGMRSFEISLIDNDVDRFEWEFAGEQDEMSLVVQKVQGDTADHGAWNMDEPQALRCLLPHELGSHPLTSRLCRLTYLSAERLGPRDYYLYDDPQLTPVVGPRGEYAVSVLHSGSDSRVLPGLVKDGTPPTRSRQVEAYMHGFFPGCVLDIQPVRRANAVTLGVLVSRDTDYHRPVHTGFGITQVLPIVIAALSADPQDILVIENPEVHLHPAGQAAMGEFLGKVSSAGVQVMVETHSDHVLNGIRRAVKGGVLSSDDVALHFFSPRSGESDSSTPQVQSPAINSDGNTDSWPAGFFDQFDNDMNYFADWG